MGRAIVRDPPAFLMDEPLSNLDAKLRVQMRTEVSQLQHRLGTTTVYVTHDQTEAMTLGDRVAVMRAGVLQQVGTPPELYDNPANLFVAGFIGSPAMNFMPATSRATSSSCRWSTRRCARVIEKIGGDRRPDRGHPPEAFEDAALVGDKRNQGVVFRRRSTWSSRSGSELYAHFPVEARGRRVAGAPGAGRGRRHRRRAGRGGEGQVVARLDAASKAHQGQEAELWLDTSKITSSSRTAACRDRAGPPQRSSDLSRSITSSFHSCVRMRR